MTAARRTGVVSMVGVGGLWLIATVSGRGGGLTRKMEVICVVRLRVGGNGGVVLLGAMSVDRRKGLIGKNHHRRQCC